jgi:seryl-tRNA synthetase
MNPAGGMTKPKKVSKKVGAKIKADDDVDDPKKLANRLRQRKYRENQGKQIGGVVDDLDKCDEERAELKEEKVELQDKVKSLTTLLKNCDDQVADILKSVNSMKNIGAKTKKPAKSTAPDGVLGKEAGKILYGAMKGKLARNKMKAQEKEATFDILLR